METKAPGVLARTEIEDLLGERVIAAEDMRSAPRQRPERTSARSNT